MYLDNQCQTISAFFCCGFVADCVMQPTSFLILQNTHDNASHRHLFFFGIFLAFFCVADRQQKKCRGYLNNKIFYYIYKIMQSTRYFIKSLLSMMQWTCFFREKPLAYFQNGQFKNVQNGIVGVIYFMFLRLGIFQYRNI